MHQFYILIYNYVMSMGFSTTIADMELVLAFFWDK